MLAILAPGQGAQTPGQLRPWLALDGVEARLRWWSAAVGIDLLDAGCDAPAETIRDTAIAQPLIVANGLIAAEQLGLPLAEAPAEPRALVAGHSVGEITAAAVAGSLDAQSALVLVGLRGRAMAQASARTPTGMTAVLGGDPDEVTKALEALGLTAANRNGAGQIVAAGTLEDLARLADNPPPGTRLRPLSVAGAFHTHHMASARDSLAAVAPGIRPGVPTLGQLSNADGALVTDGAELVSRLVTQVAAPVRWDLCLEAMRRAGVTAVIELPPAGTLAGIARRELRGAKILAVKTPDDLPAARELIAEYLPTAGAPAPAAGLPAGSANTDGALVGAAS